jgi:hypothetical protein
VTIVQVGRLGKERAREGRGGRERQAQIRGPANGCELSTRVLRLPTTKREKQLEACRDAIDKMLSMRRPACLRCRGR